MEGWRSQMTKNCKKIQPLLVLHTALHLMNNLHIKFVISLMNHHCNYGVNLSNTIRTERATVTRTTWSPVLLHCDWTFTFISMSTHATDLITNFLTWCFATYSYATICREACKAPKWNGCQRQNAESKATIRRVPQLITVTVASTFSLMR